MPLCAGGLSKSTSWLRFLTKGPEAKVIISPVALPTLEGRAREEVWQSETSLQPEPGLGPRPHAHGPLQMTGTVCPSRLFHLKKKKKKDTGLYKEENIRKKGLRSRENSGLGAAPGTAAEARPSNRRRLADAPGTRRPAGLPHALPLPTSPRAAARTRVGDGRLRKRKME